MKRMAVLIAAVIVLAACGHPLIPASALRPARGPAVTALAVPSGSAVPAGPTARAVLGKPVVGIDLYALSNYPAAEVTVLGQRILAYIKYVLKADAVGIVWNFYAASRQSDTVQATRDTLSARNVGILTRIAVSDHLKVQYRPLIMVRAVNNPWEGKILPDHPARWFRSYYHAELPYLRMARQLNISEFVTATEMHDLNSSPLWPSFFAKVSHIYHGRVSYAAWGGDYFPSYRHLPPTGYVGMDMYYRLHLPPNATSAEVTAAWESIFGKLPVSVLRRTIIDETAIQARAGAYWNPANLRTWGRLRERVQANWYTAACRTVHRYHLGGVFFWKVDLTDNPAYPATSLSTFEERAGAAAISNCARIMH
jgi:hypothetical protein